ncbi:MAG: hypothetical protein AAF830_02630 [Pseudomonadota bacterium]
MNKLIAIATKTVVSATFLAAAAHAGDADVSDVQAAADLPLTEAMIDAARSFARVDSNRDGVIDADEYASQRVVSAQLARFRRAVEIDGQTLISLPLPEDVANRMGDSEKTALGAVARRDFHVRAFGKEGLDAALWQETQLETFYTADLDGDGVLREAELVRYLRAAAGELNAALPAS